MAQVLQPGVRDQIVHLGRPCGFPFFTLDLAGFASGPLNH